MPARRDAQGRFIKGSGAGGAVVRERDTGLVAFLARARGLAGARVTVGVQGAEAGALHPSGMTNAEIAAVHEFGAPRANVPQRSFLRATADEGDWNKRLSKAIESVAGSGADPKQALHVVGEEFRAAVIERIKAGIPPPLQPETIARKGEETPLIDTGALIGAISVVVK